MLPLSIWHHFLINRPTFPLALVLQRLRLHLPLFLRTSSSPCMPMSVIPLNSFRHSPFASHSTLSRPTHLTSLEVNMPIWTNPSEPSRIPRPSWAIHPGHRTPAVSPFI